jgi:radical SAM protein with 4Fe4S-binding SPASM domain
MVDAHQVGLPLQVNITIGRHNLSQLEQLLELSAKVGVCLCSVFFLVPTGRATAELRLTAQECEEVFAVLWRWQKSGRLAIKTTEAPHYRRFVLQQQKADGVRTKDGMRGGIPLGQIGTNDGKGIMFISHIGEIYPSGFLPIACGQFPFDSLVKVYQNATLFRALRDGDQLNGKCGVCEYRNVCGGSRSRSYSLTGDPLASEPDCVYLPPKYEKESVPC